MSSKQFLLISVLLIASCQRTTAVTDEPKPETTAETKAEHVENTIELSKDEAESSGIQVAEVKAGTLSNSVTIQGVVTAPSGRNATVYSPFPGRLIPPGGGLPIVGSSVNQGQLLGTVEQEISATEQTTLSEKQIDLKSQIDQGKTDVAQKTRDLERAQALYDGGVIPQKQLQQAETDLAISKSRLEMSQQALASYQALESQSAANPRRIPITAPISGTVVTVNVAPYQLVDSTKAAFEIADLRTVWVEAQVFEDYFAGARSSQSVEITTRAAPGRTFRGRFISASPRADAVSKTRGVMFEVANPQQVFAIGMNVDVFIPSGATVRGTIVPASAVIEEQDHSVVFVEEEPGKYRRVEVKVGVRGRDAVLITDGIHPGDKVVSQGAPILVSAAEASAEEKPEEEK